MAIPYFSLFSTSTMIISWMVLTQGWSLCFLIVRNGRYITEGPNTRYQNSDVGVLLLWSRFIWIWFFAILPPSLLLMISFLEQNQPQGCLSHSRENTCKHTSAGVRAFKWLLKQGVLRDALEVPDWQLQNLCSSPHAGTGRAKTAAAQHCLPNFERVKAWPFFPAILVRSTKRTNCPYTPFFS